MKCITCQQVKAEHQRPVSKLQPLQVSEWKWVHIKMDFVVGLPRSQAGYDAIWIVVDRLTKTTHFHQYKMASNLESLENLYIKEIVILRGVPASIISDKVRVSQPNSGELCRKRWGHSWISILLIILRWMANQWTIQTLEDMFPACILDFKTSWDKILPSIEFAYDNSYHSNI